MDGAPPSPHRYHISADRGAVAAGRDAHVHQDLWFLYRPCPHCEFRWITAEARMCRHCRQRRRLARGVGVLIAATIGFGVCLAIGIRAAHRCGRDGDLFFASAVACAVFGGGYCAWSRCVTAQHLRRARRYVKKMSGGGVITFCANAVA